MDETKAPGNGTLAEQGKHMAQNIAEVFDISGQIWKTFLAGQLQEGAPTRADPLNTWPTFAELYRTMWDNPKQVADATIEFWAAQQKLWQNSMLRWLGSKEAVEDLQLPHMMKADKRFAHKEWSENALFEYLKQSYLLTSGFIQDTVGTVGEMDPKERRKAVFYTRQFVEAMNPANFFALNPEVLEATVEQKGENLVRGLKMMLADLERGKGKLLIRQTDMDAFEVGRNTAVSPGEVVFQNDLIQLIQYAPATEKVYAKPLLIIPPWINKYYILDLNPKKSMVKWLVDQGHTVFIISWVNPDERHGAKTWEDYMFEGGLTAIDKVLEETGQKSMHLVSYCVGGTMAGTLMAWLGKHNDKRVASATFFTAQLDFQDAGELQIFVDEHILEVVGEDMEKGYLPADRMAQRLQHAAGERPDLGLHGLELPARKGPLPLRPPLLERQFHRDAGANAPLLSPGVLHPRRVRQGRVQGGRHADHAQRHQGPGLSRGHQGGPHRSRRLGLSRRQGDDPGEAALRALGLRPYRRRGQSAGAREVPVLDQPRHDPAVDRGVAHGRRGDPRKLVAGLGRLAPGALRQARARPHPRREARRARACARLLRQGPLRHAGSAPRPERRLSVQELAGHGSAGRPTSSKAHRQSPWPRLRATG